MLCQLLFEFRQWILSDDSANAVETFDDLACFDLIGCVLYNTQFHDDLYLSANLSTALSVACGNPNMSPKVSVSL